MTYYPLSDRPTAEECDALEFPQSEAWQSWMSQGRTEGLYLVVEPTGETRPPKAGEWFLSGAIVEGYRALNDLSDPYPIARLVKIRRRLIDERA